MTPYLQAGDIAVFRPFKDHLSKSIDEWKKSDAVQFTPAGNPKKPSREVVHGWVRDAWSNVSVETLKKGIAASGFSDDYKKWHITNHGIHGKSFKEAWEKQESTGIHVENNENAEEPAAGDEEHTICLADGDNPEEDDEAQVVFQSATFPDDYDEPSADSYETPEEGHMILHHDTDCSSISW